MSENGHAGGMGMPGPPDGAVILTLELLERVAKRWTQLPALSARLKTASVEDMIAMGWIRRDDDPAVVEARAASLKEHGVWVEIQALAASETISTMPYIAGSENWPSVPKEREQAWEAWRANLTAEQRKAYDDDVAHGQARLLAMALVTPKVPVDQIRMFRDDLQYLVLQVMELSGLTIAAPEKK